MTGVDRSTPLDSFVVLCRRQPWPDVNDLIAAAAPPGAQLRWLAADCPHPETVRALATADILMGSWVRGWSFSRSDFASAPRLRLVQLMSAGFDGLDLAAPAAEGVVVANMGSANASTVAEHAVMLVLALLRKLPQQVQLVKAGGWRPAPAIGELRGKTVGIVGMGAIALQVVQRLCPFGARLQYYARRRLDPDREAALGLVHAQLPELLQTSDIVSLHVALTNETRHLIGKWELALMKPTSLIVNTGRGGLIDEAALAQALAEGRLGGAALDVLDREPPDQDNPLRELDNVIITPHQAGLSPDAWPRIVQLCWENVVRAARGQETHHRVSP